MTTSLDASFRAGGLATGLDTNSIVDQLVALQQRPMDQLTARQKNVSVQLSSLGTLQSRLQNLKSALNDLKTGGAARSSSVSTPSTLDVVGSSAGTSGRFSVEVTQLAQAARARSSAFGTGATTVPATTLGLSVQGTSYSISIADGSSLQQAADAINAAGAPVRAAVLDDGTQTYLSLTNLTTGYPLGGVPGDALSITETVTGGSGQALGLAITQAAQNARVKVDGLTFERATNDVSGAVPGLTLRLKKAAPGAPEDLVLGTDTAASAKAMQVLVDTYNAVAGQLQASLATTADSDRSTSLAAISAVRNLQDRLRAATQASGTSGGIRTLSELGVRTNQDGTIRLDSVALGKALEKDPASVDALFKGTTGPAASITSLVDQFTKSDGVLAATKTNLQAANKRMSDTQLRMQTRLDAYKQTLIRQFTAMESTVSGLKALDTFISQNLAAKSSSKG